MRQRMLRSVLVVRIGLLAALGGLMFFFSACGGAMQSVGTPAATPSVQGRVHGGQPAVQAATVQLYAVNTTTYGGASQPLLSPPATTNQYGGFIFTNPTCPGGDPEIYIVATGGNAGTGSNNPNIAMMAAIGPCSTLTPTTFIDIDEVSTVAAVFALSPFMSTGEGANIGASASNATGLANAFDTATNLLADTSQGAGTSPGPNVPAGATVPSAKINTLADIISGCINSDPNTSTECADLFTATTSATITPSNTIDALLSIARYPANNVGGIFGHLPGTPPFTPVITQPPDWTLAINYTGGNLSNPHAIAADGSGNIWVANTGNSNIVEYSPLGELMPASGFSTGINFPWGLAIDGSGNAWVANTGSNNIVGISGSGGSITGSPYTLGGLNSDGFIAIDNTGDLWASNQSGGPDFSGSVSEFTSGGTALSPDPDGFDGGGIQDGEPYWLAIAADGSGNAWVANYFDGVTKLLANGTAAGGSPYLVAGLASANPEGIAIGASGTVWVANGNASLSELNSTGGAISGGSGYTGGGLNSPFGIAIDGLGNAWAANLGGNSISEFDSSGNPLSPDPAGYGSGSAASGGAGMNGPFGLTIDGSGNVWVTNYFDVFVTEVVGIAAPTVTPLATAAANNSFGTLP